MATNSSSSSSAVPKEFPLKQFRMRIVTDQELDTIRKELSARYSAEIVEAMIKGLRENRSPQEARKNTLIALENGAIRAVAAFRLAQYGSLAVGCTYRASYVVRVTVLAYDSEKQEYTLHLEGSSGSVSPDTSGGNLTE